MPAVPGRSARTASALQREEACSAVPARPRAAGPAWTPGLRFTTAGPAAIHAARDRSALRVPAQKYPPPRWAAILHSAWWARPPAAVPAWTRNRTRTTAGVAERNAVRDRSALRVPAPQYPWVAAIPDSASWGRPPAAVPAWTPGPIPPTAGPARRSASRESRVRRGNACRGPERGEGLVGMPCTWTRLEHRSKGSSTILPGVLPCPDLPAALPRNFPVHGLIKTVSQDPVNLPWPLTGIRLRGGLQQGPGNKIKNI